MLQHNAQKINSFSVQQAVEYAKQNSVQVKNALLDILIQKQTNRDVTSIALPQINGQCSVTRNIDIPVQIIPDFIAPSTYQVLIDEGVKNGSGQPVTILPVVLEICPFILALPGMLMQV